MTSWLAPLLSEQEIVARSQSDFQKPNIRLAPNKIDQMSLLKTTNQMWKLYLPMTMMVICGGGILFQGTLSELIGKGTTLTLVGLGGLFGMASFILATFWIRCPKCKLKLFYFAVSKQELGSWLPWLLSQKTCPKCNFGG